MSINNMTTVIFNFTIPESINYPHVVKKLLNRWAFTCKAFDVYNLIVISEMDLKLSDSEISFTCVKTLDEALKMTKGVPVYIEEGGKDLKKFKHPKNATYIFGSDFFKGENKKAISINTKIALYSEIACGIVLNGRVNG